MAAFSIDTLHDGEPLHAPEHVLGVVALAGAAPAELAVGLPPVGNLTGMREVWRSEEPVFERGTRDAMSFARAEGLVFGMQHHPVPPGGIEAVAKVAYETLFDTIEQCGCPYLLRISNYIPDINLFENGIERYWAFNAGRQAAFAARRRVDIQAPAACGLGCGGERLSLFFLAASTPGRNIENPRQVSAFAYPPQYGPRSPLFARATLTARMLLVSGTASIVGHRSVHVGDVAGQADEAIRNVEAILAEAERAGATLIREAMCLKVYLRRAGDRPAVEQQIRLAGLPPPAAWLRSDICRRELDLELEAHLPCRFDPLR